MKGGGVEAVVRMVSGWDIFPYQLTNCAAYRCFCTTIVANGEGLDGKMLQGGRL